MLCMDARNVVVLLNELEDLGHIIRRRDPADRRRHRVYLTSSGRQALKRAARAQQDVEEELLQTLSADERATLWRSSPASCMEPSPTTLPHPANRSHRSPPNASSTAMP